MNNDKNNFYFFYTHSQKSLIITFSKNYSILFFNHFLVKLYLYINITYLNYFTNNNKNINI